MRKDHARFWSLVGAVILVVVALTLVLSGKPGGVGSSWFGPDYNSPEYLISRVENFATQKIRALENRIEHLQRRVEVLEKRQEHNAAALKE